MLFRADMMGRNFYYARQEPHWWPQDQHRTVYIWHVLNPDRRRGGPILLGCLHHDSQRIVRYRRDIGSYRTIQFPDLQQWWMECGR